jgi:hypothetical protein
MSKLDKGGDDASNKAVFAQNAPNIDNTDHLGRHFGTEPPRLDKPIDRQVVWWLIPALVMSTLLNAPKIDHI